MVRKSKGVTKIGNQSNLDEDETLLLLTEILDEVEEFFLIAFLADILLDQEMISLEMQIQRSSIWVCLLTATIVSLEAVSNIGRPTNTSLPLPHFGWKVIKKRSS